MSTSAPISRPDDLVFTSFAPKPPASKRRWWIAAVLSVAVHGLLLLTIEAIPSDWARSSLPTQLQARLSERPVVHLVAPNFSLTQPQPNTRKPTTQVSLPQLLSRPEPVRPSPPPAAPKFTPPSAPPAQAAKVNTPAAPPALPAPPKADATPVATAGVSAQALPSLPPPPAEEKPKLAFESLSPTRTSSPEPTRGLARIQLPKSGIDEALRTAGSQQPSGGLTVGESGELGGIERPGKMRQPSHNASNVELLSDPQGVDFKPYLIRVLASIRRNWYAVLPESASMGRQGKVQIQFAISRDGHVPKLVLASGSGTDAFDRAAVAGISASNPFPPLPPEFHGDQIRLQLSFLYNAR